MTYKEKLKSGYDESKRRSEELAERPYNDCWGYAQARTIDEAYYIGQIKVYEKLLGL